MGIIKPTQELSKTRTAMGWHVMNSLDKIINENRKFADRYGVIFHIKLFSSCPEMISNRIILSKVQPPKMLSTIVFEVDNIEDKLLWALPPDIPQEDIAYQQDENIVPETAEAAKESGALYLAVRRDTVAKEAFYIVLGLKQVLRREILGIYNIPSASASGWKEVIQDLKQRGLQQVLMVIAEQLKGLREVITEELPEAKLQRRLVHPIRDLLLKARAGHKAEMAAVFRLEDSSDCKEKAYLRLQTFVQKWKRVYPHLPLKLKETEWESYFAYLQCPSSVHRMVYTTHWIERLNKEIRRTHQGSFPKHDNPMNLIAAALMNFEQKVYSHPIPSFMAVKDQLDCMFKEGYQTQLD